MNEDRRAGGGPRSGAGNRGRPRGGGRGRCWGGGRGRGGGWGRNEECEGPLRRRLRGAWNLAAYETPAVREE